MHFHTILFLLFYQHLILLEVKIKYYSTSRNYTWTNALNNAFQNLISKPFFSKLYFITTTKMLLLHWKKLKRVIGSHYPSKTPNYSRMSDFQSKSQTCQEYYFLQHHFVIGHTIQKIITSQKSQSTLHSTYDQTGACMFWLISKAANIPKILISWFWFLTQL